MENNNKNSQRKYLDMTIVRRELMSNGLFEFRFERERENEKKEREKERLLVEICPVITMKLLLCKS